MRTYVPDYQLQTPRTLDDALLLLARQPGVWKPFAGGTDLMVLLEAGKLPHKNYINIWNLDDLLVRIRLPRANKNVKQYYRKVGTRKAQAISKVCFAGVADIEDNQVREIRIALGSVAPIPVRCLRTEAALKGNILNRSAVEASKVKLSREISPITDIRSTRDYRLRVSINLLEDFLLGLV